MVLWSTTHDQTVNSEQDYGADRGDDNGPYEAPAAGTEEGLHYEASDKSAGYPEQYRHDNATRIIPRPDQLTQRSRYYPDHDPGQYSPYTHPLTSSSRTPSTSSFVPKLEA